MREGSTILTWTAEQAKRYYLSQATRKLRGELCARLGAEVANHMSRSIAAWYKNSEGRDMDVDVGHHHLLGTQDGSMAFWCLPIHQALGIERLSQLGVLDPVWFKGWEDLAILEKEVAILEAHIDDIPFPDEPKRRWICNLRICLDRLKTEAPADSVPEFMIG